MSREFSKKKITTKCAIMGNVCSSGQSKKKDSLSEKSDDSYGTEKDCNKQEFDEQKLAPLADPEMSDIAKSKTIAGEVLMNKESAMPPSTNKIQENAPQIMSDTPKSIINTTQNKELRNGLEHKATVPHYLLTLQGKSLIGRNIERNKKIVVYVLSDNNPEYKKHMGVIYSLQKQLLKKCQEKGFEFLISNLHSTDVVDPAKNLILTKTTRWTHSPLEAQGGHEEAANCLSEINRHSSTAYVIPILLLGSSLGPTMLPLTIESQDFTQVLVTATDEEKCLLEKWYIIDNCYQPMCHRLNTELCTESSSPLDNELNNLFEILLRLFSDDLKDSYMSTIVEQEINNTVFMSQELAKRCIWIHDTEMSCFNGPNVTTAYDKEVNRRMSRLYEDLKAHLSERNMIRISQSMAISDEELAIVIENLIQKCIDCIFEEHTAKSTMSKNTNGVDHVLLEEIELIGHYSNILAQNSPNFEIMNDIKRYIKDNTSHPLIVSGPSGCGKSVFISKIVENIFKWKPETNLVLRYANLAARSSDIVLLLGSLACQLSVLAYGRQIRANHTLEEYAEIIRDIILQNKCSFVLILDSVDDIMDEVNVDWLPLNLNGTCKVILTLTENEEKNPIIQILEDKGIPSKCFIKMKQFSTRQWQDVLSTGGGDYYAANGAIKIPQEWKILNGKTPFHAKSLWWLAWLGHSSIIMTNIKEMMETILQVIESKFSNDNAEILMLILAVSQWGIRECDCIDIFQKTIQTDSKAAFRIWSRFCWLMGPMLITIRNIRIADKQLRHAILSKYQHKHAQIHQIIRDFYDRQDACFQHSKESNPIYNTEKFLKLPYHHFYSIMEDHTGTNKIDILVHCFYFTELQWMANKVHATGVENLMSDVLICEHFVKTSVRSYIHIQMLKTFLCQYMHELNYDGFQFYTLFKFYLKSRIREDPSVNDDQIIRSWLEATNELEIPFLDIINKSFGEEVKSQRKSFDALVNLPHQGFFIASISTEREEICVWDIRKCTRVRVLNGISQPTAICPFGAYDAAVLCRREIKVINLDEGKFKVTLKGVMNQKMPFFGLHDQKHLVCLSRNRMYVNLMNLESGDCITTFKAGEDRFLNSLLVSGDGRILVCGDETQKPFPLLVWHLSQRKLLYDLRIPHHDFLTALSAITHEGSYVCVVAKELNEPTPNFIVVYDLQSGTLFKKWKPTCDTTSLAISQTNACVIAGLENAKILIWDLVTGNCRATLNGHNAPVTLLKLDPMCKVLMSTDKEGRDNALRLWELQTGKSLGVFKPPATISACEILPNCTYVAVALADRSELLTLALNNFALNLTPDDSLYVQYGNQDNQNKIFQLNLDKTV
ncbi:uncharacterized protein LOC106089892 isoform X2 [Stomoxys calcitrans]|uniref:uncharacterized protein LOC106089892 isoform X2 n=1 Tax=Stomoxys calcitrans TaxID=35570 RepID=UPI0027E39AB5|nr:uncharacterized protein LOC106089892 isoform X2 [Stomoxys calcitrans]